MYCNNNFDIIHVRANSNDYDWQGTEIEVGEVRIKGHPNNRNIVWVRSKTPATSSNAWPLRRNQETSFGLSSLKDLHIHINRRNDRAIVLYFKRLK